MTNKEAAQERLRRWRKNNPEKARAIAKRYRSNMSEENKIRLKALKKQYRDKNPKRPKERMAENIRYANDSEFRERRLKYAMGRYYNEINTQPKTELQWVKKAIAINRTVQRELRSSSPDLSLLQRLAQSLSCK